MSSWVLVSERMMVNGGGESSRGDASATVGVTSSAIFSFFLKTSFSVMFVTDITGSRGTDVVGILGKGRQGVRYPYPRGIHLMRMLSL